ncbi:unnamed protein product [Lactuca saligna]|uniref:Uncharacterized protein n=1 Tax=Lactuca saligna TaxID=75948 RepID=A0AA35ZD14_LACSI|nr:unnamed protein product [Lactuca saligna]
MFLEGPPENAVEPPIIAYNDDVLMLQECGYEPHEIADFGEPVSPVEMIEDHLEEDLEEDVNEIEDNLLEDNLEMGVDVNEIEDHLETEGGVIRDLVPPVQGEVAIQDLDAYAWVSEDDKEIDEDNEFIEDTQVVGRPMKRKISERIVKIKPKKAVHDKDGRGSSIEKPVNLE